jgi:phosphoglycolate phosphatase
MVARLLPRWRFQRVLGAGGDFPKKPDPAGAVHIAKEMSVPADSVFYTGDTAVDMKTARGAGMCAVGVLWGFREREELEEAGARVLIERPQELLELL